MSDIEGDAGPAARQLEKYGEFLLAGEITLDSAVRLAQSMLHYAYSQGESARQRPIVLTIFSMGGNLDAGYHLGATLARLQAMGFEVHTRVQGGVYSTAFLLAQYGNQRQMDATAIAHIHTIQLALEKQPDTIILEDYADAVAKRKMIMAETLAERNTAGAPYNRPTYWIDHFMNGREHHLTARQCLEMGLIDEIVGGVERIKPLAGTRPTPLELVADHPAA